MNDFTNFTRADEKTFVYRIGTLERQIMDIFQTFRVYTPIHEFRYIWGAKMESFVRSHKRERPTQYDPRNRRGILRQPVPLGQTVITDPYPSVTTEVLISES
jgi:hypothetical protein